METGITKAIRIAGSQTALGNLLGVTPQAVQKWSALGCVPGQRCRQVEAALDGAVSRSELNPRLFGAPPAAVAHLPRCVCCAMPQGTGHRDGCRYLGLAA